MTNQLYFFIFSANIFVIINKDDFDIECKLFDVYFRKQWISN